jgi:hypothetical protein
MFSSFEKELHIINCQPQENKQHLFMLTTFPRLILLNLVEAHVDYAEQLLCDKNTHLPSLLDLFIEYKSLAVITNNFINGAMCRNCAKIKKLHINSSFELENYRDIFLHYKDWFC